MPAALQDEEHLGSCHGLGGWAMHGCCPATGPGGDLGGQWELPGEGDRAAGSSALQAEATRPCGSALQHCSWLQCLPRRVAVHEVPWDGISLPAEQDEGSKKDTQLEQGSRFPRVQPALMPGLGVVAAPIT